MKVKNENIRRERTKFDLVISQKRSRFFGSKLLALTLVWAFSALFVVPSNAQISGESKKVSEHLRKHAVKSQSKQVDVIIQLNSSPSGLLNGILQRSGFRVKGNYTNLRLMAVSLPTNMLDSIAALPEVIYVAKDEELAASGHISQTTGADDVRTETVTTTNSILGIPVTNTITKTFDGTGIGIAVLDSGIDPNHKNLLGRVIVNRDFTGEDRTDDPFGHGSHVAGMASGKNNLYGGIASNANILNLRVLDSNGVGTVSNLLNSLN